jgi:hypothetical protein
MEISRWAVQQLMRTKPSKQAQDEWEATNRILGQLTDHTVPYTIAECLADLAPEEVVKKIEANPNIAA